jgi:phage terminase large subunit-like protein
MMAGSVALSVAKAGGAVAWIPPTYKNARPLWRFAETHTAPVAKQLKINKTERTIEFPGGGWLGIYTADNPVGILGEAFDLVIMEEAARVNEVMWYETVMPTLADREGRAMLISTPRGRNWFWREFQAGMEDGEYQHSWNAPSRANPKPQIIKAYWKAKSILNADTFAQEWDAQFVDSSGMVFRRVQEAAVLSPQEPQPGGQYIAGVDVAASIDYTVVTVMDSATKRMVYMDRFNRVDYNVLIDRLEAIYRRWNLQAMKIEANSIGQPVIDQLVARGMDIIPFTTTSATKQVIVQNLQAAFENAQLQILNDPVLIGELLSFESKRSPSGSFSYSAPEGMHDDAVMSLAIAWDAVTNRPWLIS